jgi:hypothetical protein
LLYVLVGSLLPTPPLVSSSLGWTGMLVLVVEDLV